MHINQRWVLTTISNEDSLEFGTNKSENPCCILKNDVEATSVNKNNCGGFENFGIFSEKYFFL